MTRRATWALLVIILLTASALRQYRLLDFPYFGDEVDEGDIALEILHGNLALFYPQNEGNEPLYQFILAPFFAILGDSVIANRWPSTVWSTIFVALMYTYARILFHSRRVGVMAAGLAAVLWLPTIFGRLGLREISQPVMMTPALLGLVLALRDSSDQRAWRAAVVGGIFAGLTAYTFLSGRGFLVVVILFLGYLVIAHRDRLRRRWRPLLVYLALTISITLPLLVYLQLRPELDFHVQDLGTRGLLALANLEGFVRNVQATVGMFTVSGDMNWVRNIPGRPVFPGIEGGLFYLGVALCVWRWHKSEFILQLMVIATFLMPNIFTEDPPRFTRSIGILPGLMVIPVLPIEWVWTRMTRPLPNPRRIWLNVTSAAIIALLGISILTRTAFDMFQVWIDNPGVYGMTLAFYDSTGKYVNQSTDTTPLNYVMDVFTDWRKHNIQRVVQRDDVAMRYSVHSAFVFPDDAHGNRIAFQIFGAPALPLLKTFLDLDSPIYIDPRTESEGRRLLRVYSVPRARLDEHIALANRQAVFVPDTNIPVATPIRVDDLLQFIGYEILNPDAHPGGELDVLSYWRVLQRPPNIAVFLQLVDSNHQVVAQFDGFEAITADLSPGDIVVQLHALKLPDDLPASTFRLELGAYTRDDLKRLPLNTGTDYVWLTGVPPIPQ